MAIQNQQPPQVIQSPTQTVQNKGVVSWEASEFLHHEKQSTWFIGLFLISAGLAVGMYFLVDIFASAIVLMLMVVIMMYGQRKPRTLEFSISDQFITIDVNNYPIGAFKSFSIERTGAFGTINFYPIKRFLPPITMYYQEKDEQRIMDVLGGKLPQVDHSPDIFDRLSTKLRF